MILPLLSCHQNHIKILIPSYYNCSFFFYKIASFFFSFLFISIFLSSGFLFSSTIITDNNKPPQSSAAATAMKVHPVPTTKKRNNITIQYYANNINLRNPQNLSTGSHKKLRRLPHIFARVLELPFRSDADVAVEENPDCFKFVVETTGIGEVRAHMIQIHPGITKIVVRQNGSVELSSLDELELELDTWRFRLPETTRPELASAVYVDGELIVTVPKGRDLEGLEEGEGSGRGSVDGGEKGDFSGGMGNNRLVLVQ